MYKVFGYRVWDDFDIETNNLVGIVIEVEGTWIYILNRNCHSWLNILDEGVYVGFMKEMVEID